MHMPMATVIATSPTGEIVFRDDFEVSPRTSHKMMRLKGREIALTLIEKVLAHPENDLGHEGPAYRWTFEIVMGSGRKESDPAQYTY